MRFDRTRFISWTIAISVFLASALFGSWELKGRLFINDLVSRNEGERTINLLMSAAREFRDRNAQKEAPDGDAMHRRMGPREWRGPIEETQEFIKALQSHKVLSERILGLAAYDSDGKPLLRYGTAPEKMPDMGKNPVEGNPPRNYRYDIARKALCIGYPFPVFRPSQGQEARLAFSYYELKDENLFRENIAAWLYFALWIVLSALIILLVRRTTLKNKAYREELRSQRELVALGSAARTLAHEIKNPLSAIALQTDLIARIAPGTANEELKAIGDEVSRIRLLVDRIGDFLREPAGQPERLDLTSFTAQILAHAGKDGLAVPLEVREAGLLALADGSRIRSVIENIVRNAFDSGSDSAEVRVVLSASGPWAVLEVLDRGKGLPPPAEVERLFDPFYTTKIKGFGLGLALSRRFAEAAGGNLTLESREGGGAVARLKLKRIAE